MCFLRRDTIVTRGDAASKVSTAAKQVVTKGTFKRQMSELRKKIKSTVQVSFQIIHLANKELVVFFISNHCNDSDPNP